MNNKKIYSYIFDGKLDLEMCMSDYTNYVYSIIKNTYINMLDEDIEEITLDVFFTLWNNQKKLDINKEMSPYIAGITRNLIKKKYRDMQNTNSIEEYETVLSDLKNIELSFIEKEKHKIINEELNKLKSDDKNIFILYYYYENSIRRIAEIMNASESKIKSRLFRIRKKLNRGLQKRGYKINEKS